MAIRLNHDAGFFDVLQHAFQQREVLLRFSLQRDARLACTLSTEAALLAGEQISHIFQFIGIEFQIAGQDLIQQLVVPQWVWRQADDGRRRAVSNNLGRHLADSLHQDVCQQIEFVGFQMELHGILLSREEISWVRYEYIGPRHTSGCQ